MTVAAILEGRKGVPAITVPRGMRVREAVALLAERKIGAVPVMDGDKVAGVMSERDVIYCLARDGADMLDWPVEKIMTAPAITVESTMTVLGALSLMTSRRIRHLPVVDGNQLVGVVSIGDLVKHRLDQIEAEAQAMLSYIQTA
ncbi:MAG TPA: CBS domain-containing protein [Allosphingosinicella sp.]|nr:CBS domain-containing protein [Allosphingosinicella sp.]